MLIPMAPTALVEETAVRTDVRPTRPVQESLWEPRNDGSPGEEEPEIVGLLAAHYRSLLLLRRLTSKQRTRIGRLLAACESRLRGRSTDIRSRCPPLFEPLISRHDHVEWLTAIGLYAAGAQRALSRGRPEVAAQALARIVEQVDEARVLLGGASRPQAYSGGYNGRLSLPEKHRNWTTP